MTLQKHKKIIGILFILIASYLAYGMFNYGFKFAPIWQKPFYVALLGLYFAAGYGYIKETKWSNNAAIPCAVIPIIAFPVGTALTAYFFWVLFKLDVAIRRPNSIIAQKTKILSFLDFQLLGFLTILVLYATFAGNTIGGLNFIAATLAILLSAIGIVSKIFKKSATAWIYVFTAALSISLFFIRSFDTGYGP